MIKILRLKASKKPTMPLEVPKTQRSMASRVTLCTLKHRESSAPPENTPIDADSRNVQSRNSQLHDRKEVTEESTKDLSRCTSRISLLKLQQLAQNTKSNRSLAKSVAASEATRSLSGLTMNMRKVSQGTQINEELTELDSENVLNASPPPRQIKIKKVPRT